MGDIEKIEFLQNDGAILKEKMEKLDSLDYYVRTELMPNVIQERNQYFYHARNDIEKSLKAKIDNKAAKDELDLLKNAFIYN